jgi:hypothetical protein
MEPTYAPEDELGIEIDWWPFRLDIGSYLGSARLGHEGKVVENERSTGQSAKVKYAYHDVRRYGSMRGRIIRGAVKMLWAREQGLPPGFHLDRIFLDANVLYSAAYLERSELSRLWSLNDVALISSAYAIEEARRNLAIDRPGALKRLRASWRHSPRPMHRKP